MNPAPPGAARVRAHTLQRGRACAHTRTRVGGAANKRSHTRTGARSCGRAPSPALCGLGTPPCLSFPLRCPEAASSPGGDPAAPTPPPPGGRGPVPQPNFWGEKPPSRRSPALCTPRVGSPRKRGRPRVGTATSPTVPGVGRGTAGARRSAVRAGGSLPRGPRRAHPQHPPASRGGSPRPHPPARPRGCPRGAARPAAGARCRCPGTSTRRSPGGTASSERGRNPKVSPAKKTGKEQIRAFPGTGSAPPRPPQRRGRAARPRGLRAGGGRGRRPASRSRF